MGKLFFWIGTQFIARFGVDFINAAIYINQYHVLIYKSLLFLQTILIGFHIIILYFSKMPGIETENAVQGPEESNFKQVCFLDFYSI